MKRALLLVMAVVGCGTEPDSHAADIVDAYPSPDLSGRWSVDAGGFCTGGELALSRDEDGRTAGTLDLPCLPDSPVPVVLGWRTPSGWDLIDEGDRRSLGTVWLIYGALQGNGAGRLAQHDLMMFREPAARSVLREE
jgi:hypothetical protein